MAVSRLVVANDLILADIFHKDCIPTCHHIPGAERLQHLSAGCTVSPHRWASARDAPETCHRTLDAFLLHFCAKDH